ncbi:MAG: divergent polysaccharide deacetylase family protein, partial [Hyphomicrobiales bacterium]|nr:divergent polysaccharide deacetylase family protein [Hyphomicrobiales bacterium]
MRDEVNEPLGRARPARESAVERARRLGPRYALWTAVVALALCGGELARRAGASGGGEPFAVARIEAAPPAPVVASPPVEAPSPSAAAGALDAASTVKVVRNGGAPSGPQIIDVAQALGIRLAPAPDPRLVEASRYGLLPRIGPDGARPANVYARPIAVSARMKPGSPRIALLIGGLGLNAEGTTQAIAGLPADVTLGFAPYGGDLQ